MSVHTFSKPAPSLGSHGSWQRGVAAIAAAAISIGMLAGGMAGWGGVAYAAPSDPAPATAAHKTDADQHDPWYLSAPESYPGEVVTVMQVGDTHLPAGTVFSLEDPLNSPEFAVDAQTGVVTVRVPADAPVGAGIGGSIKITYPDKSVDTAGITVLIARSAPASNPTVPVKKTDAEQQHPGYADTQGVIGSSVKVAQTGDAHLPAGTVFTLTESPDATVDAKTGEVTVNIAADAQEGMGIPVSVKITYPDASVDTADFMVLVLASKPKLPPMPTPKPKLQDAEQYHPSYEAVVRSYPGGVVTVAQMGDTKLPAGTVFALTKSPESSIDAKTGKVTVRVPVDAPIGAGIPAFVTVTYPDTSVGKVQFTVLVDKPAPKPDLNSGTKPTELNPNTGTKPQDPNSGTKPKDPNSNTGTKPKDPNSNTGTKPKDPNSDTKPEHNTQPPAPNTEHKHMDEDNHKHEQQSQPQHACKPDQHADKQCVPQHDEQDGHNELSELLQGSQQGGNQDDHQGDQQRKPPAGSTGSDQQDNQQSDQTTSEDLTGENDEASAALAAEEDNLSGFELKAKSAMNTTSNSTMDSTMSSTMPTAMPNALAHAHEQLTAPINGAQNKQPQGFATSSKLAGKATNKSVTKPATPSAQNAALASTGVNIVTVLAATALLLALGVGACAALRAHQ